MTLGVPGPTFVRGAKAIDGEKREIMNIHFDNDQNTADPTTIGRVIFDPESIEFLPNQTSASDYMASLLPYNSQTNQYNVGRTLIDPSRSKKAGDTDYTGGPAGEIVLLDRDGGRSNEQVIKVTTKINDDIIYGTEGYENIFSNHGQDQIYPDAGIDTINGGLGFDMINYQPINTPIYLKAEKKKGSKKTSKSKFWIEYKDTKDKEHEFLTQAVNIEAISAFGNSIIDLTHSEPPNPLESPGTESSEDSSDSLDSQDRPRDNVFELLDLFFIESVFDEVPSSIVKKDSKTLTINVNSHNDFEPLDYKDFLDSNMSIGEAYVLLHHPDLKHFVDKVEIRGNKEIYGRELLAVYHHEDLVNGNLEYPIDDVPKDQNGSEDSYYAIRTGSGSHVKGSPFDDQIFLSFLVDDNKPSFLEWEYINTFQHPSRDDLFDQLDKFSLDDLINQVPSSIIKRESNMLTITVNWHNFDAMDFLDTKMSSGEAYALLHHPDLKHFVDKVEIRDDEEKLWAVYHHEDLVYDNTEYPRYDVPADNPEDTSIFGKFLSRPRPAIKEPAMISGGGGQDRVTLIIDNAENYEKLDQNSRHLGSSTITVNKIKNHPSYLDGYNIVRSSSTYLAFVEEGLDIEAYQKSLKNRKDGKIDVVVDEDEVFDFQHYSDYLVRPGLRRLEEGNETSNNTDEDFLTIVDEENPEELVFIDFSFSIRPKTEATKTLLNNSVHLNSGENPKPKKNKIRGSIDDDVILAVDQNSKKNKHLDWRVQISFGLGMAWALKRRALIRSWTSMVKRETLF